MPEFDIETLDENENKRFMQCLVSPRPIAWISTTVEDGVDNLAPFSSYNYVSASEPTVAFNTPNEDHGGLKDTARNALATGEFAVNVVTRDVINEVDHTSAPLPPNESEFDVAGIERAACRTIDSPRVRDAVATLECTLLDTVKVHDRLMILGDVRYVHVSEDALADGVLDTRKIATVGRLGGPYYAATDVFEVDRRY